MTRRIDRLGTGFVNTALHALRGFLKRRAVIVLTLLLVAVAALGFAPAQKQASPPGPPQRIVTIAPNAAEIICSLGAENKIVGVSKFCVYPPDLASLPRVGGLFDPDLERIIALRPDLVVIRGRCESVEQLCKRLGIAVYHDRTDKLADIERCVLDLGKLLEREKKAAAVVERFRSRLDAVRRRVANRKRPTVLLTASRRPEALANVLTGGRGSFLDELIDIAGGVNVYGHLDVPYPQVSAESIIARRPEVIIELMPEVDMTAAVRELLMAQWKRLGPTPAAASGRIYFLTEANAQIPSPRYVEIIEKVSRLLHPESDGGR